MVNVNHTVNFLGKRKLDTWECFAWSIVINGIAFEYNTGLGHFTPYTGTKRARETVWDSLYKRNRKPENGLANAGLNGWLHAPSVSDVLTSLFLDSDAGALSFNDFCADYGYNNDSLKALDIYRACMAIGPKLREALGKDYASIKAEIEALGN